jgi:hypothetical protein
MMKKLALTMLGAIIFATVAAAALPMELEPYGFLIGEWHASGSGEPGTGAGAAVFARALQDRVITRTSFAEYPAADGRPGSRHDDLMVIYVQAGGGVRADYYDSEGHVIRYSVSSPGPGRAVFVSEAESGQPRFRLTYLLEGATLNGEFAISPPGPGEAFKPYLTWQSEKK